MMTVSELIDILKDMDPDAQIIMAKTAEGGEYSPIEDVNTGFWDSKNQEVVSDEDFFEAEFEDEDDTIVKKGISSIVFWPEW